MLSGQLHVTPVLLRYLQQYPEVDAQCLFLDRVVNVVEEGIDVAVRIGELPDSSLQAVRVGRVRSYQMAPNVRSGAVQVLLKDFEPAPLPVHVGHHEGRRATQKVRAFIDLAVDTLQADPALR